MQHYIDVVQDRSGNVIGGAIVVITDNSTGLPVTVYSDAGGSVVQPTVTTDVNGTFSFYVGQGRYNFVVTKNGTTLKTVTDVDIPDDYPTAMSLLDAQNGTSTTAQTISASVLHNSFSTPTGSTLVGTTNGGTGAVTRTVASKLNDNLSAKDFGSGTTITLNVPSQYATIQSALDYLSAYRISNNTTVTIQVADGTYTLTSGINLNHPDGSQIQLVGNISTPANCIITTSSAPTFDALSVSSGHQVGLIAGFTITTPTKAGSANNTTAILAVDNSSINEVKNCVVNNWYYSISERSDSHIYAYDCTCSNAGDVSIWAFCGGEIRGSNLTVSGATDVANNLGYGFQAEYGAVLEISSSTATTCNKAGFAALSGGVCRYYSCTSNLNVGSGFVAQAGGIIEANGSSSTNNTRYGIECIGAGTVTGLSTNTGNTISADNGLLRIEQGSLGARLEANGDLRIDNNGSFSTYFNTTGGLQLSVSHTASAVNRFNLTGSITGSGLTLAAAGSDANVGAYVSSKNNAVVGLVSNTKVAFQAYSASTSNVNYVQANGSLTGVGVTLSAQGTDAVVDLILAPKGAGSYVQINGGYIATPITNTGYMSIKDNTGTVRRLMVG